MILIAHRGNWMGRNEERENDPNYVREALSNGFHAEVDVWLVDDQYYLGHDHPEYPVTSMFLMNPGIWCHAKNSEALMDLQRNGCHVFWHEEDRYTITSKGYLWAYPGEDPGPHGIAVMPEDPNDVDLALGVCADDLTFWRD